MNELELAKLSSAVVREGRKPKALDVPVDHTQPDCELDDRGFISYIQNVHTNRQISAEF
jgi:hypothetical protein